ncbi:hypothetical protein HDU98_006985 [Podochytrium sp. JEL0797]|nr:hypothetical protein HDU98_006985 [Podochytrium sp. JEL0797]
MTSSASIATSNTNTCFGLAPSFAACLVPKFNPAEPTAMCCDVVLKYNEAGCFCNKITSALLPGGAKQAKGLAKVALPICAAGKKHWKVPCEPLQGHTYNNGACPLSDMEMDAARFGTAMAFVTPILTTVFGERWATGCFDLNALIDKVSPLADSGYFASMAYGLGTISGIETAMEYFASLNAHVDRNNAVTTINPANKVAGVLPDGSIVLGGSSTWSFMNETITAPEAYYEFIFGFDGCNTATVLSTTLPSGSVLQPKKGLITAIAYINGILTMSYESAYWGPITTCKLHSKYCTGDDQQFTSEKHCLHYFTSLPLYSPVCGKAHILGGNSKICRANQLYLTALNPEKYCPRMSKHSEVCRDPGVGDDIDSFCGPGGDEEVMATVLNEYKEQVHDITVVQNATVLSPSWKWEYAKVC